MKIIYCIAGTCNSGGMERVLANKANWLVSKGNDVLIVTTDQRGKSPFFKLDERIRTVDLGIDYEVNNGGSFLNKLIHYPFKQIKHKQRLKSLLMKERADIVISMFCNDASFLPSIKDGSKKVLEIHFSRFKRIQYGRTGIWKLADQLRSKNDLKVVSRFDKFVVLTREDKGYWGDLDNITVIPNAKSFSSDTPSSLDNKRVIAVGRCCYQKAFDKLIDAWSLISDKLSGWSLHIYGNGELKEDLQKQIDSLGLSDSITLEGTTSDIKSEYLNSSIVVMSSRYEGLPMALVEAQAVGLPAVSFKCKCGPLDVIEDGVSGYLVEQDDVKSLSEKLLSVMQDDELRHKMGAAAYKNSENYTEEVVMNQWSALFESLLNN